MSYLKIIQVVYFMKKLASTLHRTYLERILEERNFTEPGERKQILSSIWNISETGCASILNGRRDMNGPCPNDKSKLSEFCKHFSLPLDEVAELENKHLEAKERLRQKKLRELNESTVYKGLHRVTV